MRIIPLIVAVLIACQVYGQELSSFSGATMGTRYSVTVACDDTTELQSKVDTLLAEINTRMSTYDPESELSRFNKYQQKDWFAVTRQTAFVAQFALHLAHDSDGAFDPTVGPAVNLWGFGPEGRRRDPPNQKEIAAALERVGYQHVEVHMDPPALRKENADIYLDFSAVAKGYAADEVSRLITENGYDASLVVIGGDVRARGRKPDGKQWTIGIEEPDGAGLPGKRVMHMENTSTSTSGDWRNSFVHQGARYSHVIDPLTARPVEHDLASVTVFADTSIQADAWSTTLLVMGEDRGLAWCEKNKVAAIFFCRQPEGGIRTQESTFVAKRVNR